MKKIIFTAMILVASMQSAMATSMAPELPQVTLSRVSADIELATLTNYGRLTVKMRNGREVSKVLALPNKEVLNNFSYDLARAELQETERLVVCMMMPVHFGRELKVSETINLRTGFPMFTGALRTVLTNRGCYMSHEVYPANPYDLETAEKLKAVVSALAIELTGELILRTNEAN